MITIFNGRRISLDGTGDEIYAQVSVAMRDKLYLFNTGKNSNPLAVFLCIALHADRNGWAYPGTARLRKSTGISTKAAMSASLKHLRAMRIDGHRVLETYREHRADGRWGQTLYRIFPDAFTDGLSNVPDRFQSIKDHMAIWDPVAKKQEGPGYDDRTLEPGYGDPSLDDPPLDHHTPEVDPVLKDTHVEDHNNVLWSQALDELRPQMTRSAFDTWLAGSRVTHVGDGTVTIQVRDAYAVQWLSSRWVVPITRTLAGIAGESLAVEFVTTDGQEP